MPAANFKVPNQLLQQLEASVGHAPVSWRTGSAAFVLPYARAATGAYVLRITPIETGGGVTRFRVEGRLAGDVIGELSQIALDVAPGAMVVLELAHVTFVDQAGARLLRHLRDAGVVFVAPSEFVLAMIGGGQP